MEKHGVVGFEPGGNGLSRRVKELNDELKGRNIQVSAICAGFKGFPLSSDEDVRKQFHTSMSEIIIAAGELGSTGVIFVPAFNNQVPIMPHTMHTRDFLCNEIDKLGTLALETWYDSYFRTTQSSRSILFAPSGRCRVHVS